MQAHTVDLTTSKLTPPHLLIARHENGDEQSWIAANGITIKRRSENERRPFEMIIDLVACYYAWDLSYPKVFQIMPFIQHVLVGDKNSGFQSNKFVNFWKKYQNAQQSIEKM